MISKYIQFSIVAVCGAASLMMAAQTADSSVPTVTLQGREFYAYKVKGGDSVYGICKKYGWDEDVLRANNTGFSTKIKKGQTLYYPVKPDVVKMQEERPFVHDIERNPIEHKVLRGETVYGIAQTYGVPVDLIYELNPSSRSGIKAGEVLKIAQPHFGNSEHAQLFYTIKTGDTLYGLAKQFNSSVESLMKLNPGISESNFRAGEVIKIVPNNAEHVLQTQTVTRDVVRSFSSYQVGKNDTWSSVSSATGVSEEALHDANKEVTELKKGEWLTVPRIESETVEETKYERTPEEATYENRVNMYDSIHGVSELNVVNVDVVLDNPSSKSNADFLRGFLMGVDAQKKNGYKINMRVVDASKGLLTLREDSLLSNTNLIIGVYDSDFPVYLGELGVKENIEVVNALDTKSELYTRNPQVIQILQPLDYFNEVVCQYFTDNFKDHKLLFVGEPDRTDQFATLLTNNVPAGDISFLTEEEMANYPLDANEKYLVYGFAAKKDGIEATLDAIGAARTASPGATLATVGRPVWIAYSQALEEKMSAADTYIPSRFFMRPGSDEMTEFESKFTSIFGRKPVKSYPEYSILGYDVANYFLPTSASNGGDYNKGLKRRDGLQNDFDIKRLNTWSGFINGTDYVIHITPLGNYEKIEVQ